MCRTLVSAVGTLCLPSDNAAFGGYIVSSHILEKQSSASAKTNVEKSELLHSSRCMLDFFSF